MASNRDPFDELTDQWSEELREAFLDAIQELRNRSKVAVIARMLEAGDVDGALRAVGIDPLNFRHIDRVMAELFNAGGEAFALDVERQVPARSPEGAIVRFFFDGRNQRAEGWLRNRSGTLITQIVEGQRQLIRTVLQSGLADGRNPRSIALDLVGRRSRATGRREGGIIGLTSGQEAWQRAYALELTSSDPAVLRRALGRGLRDKRFDSVVRKAIQSGEPIPAETRSKMLTSYRNKSLKYRADSISRNEVIKALGVAQQEAWQQAIDRGRVNAVDVIKIPISSRDERVRHNHREVEAMNREGVAWDQAYRVPAGMAPQMHAPFDEPMCRCRERIKIRRFGQAV